MPYTALPTDEALPLAALRCAHVLGDASLPHPDEHVCRHCADQHALSCAAVSLRSLATVVAQSVLL